MAEGRDDSGVVTPVRTFVSVHRREPVAEGVQAAVGVIALVVASFRDDYSLIGMVLEVPVVAAIYVAISRPWETPQLEAVVAIPPRAVIVEPGVGWARRIVGFLGLCLLILVYLIGDASTLVLLGCIFLASPLSDAIRARRLARWEKEHGLELLREKRERRPWRDVFRDSPPYYVRPRSSPAAA